MDVKSDTDKVCIISGGLPSERHRLEPNDHAYRRQLRRHLRRFGAMAKASLQSGRLRAASATPPARAPADAVSRQRH